MSEQDSEKTRPDPDATRAIDPYDSTRKIKSREKATSELFRRQHDVDADVDANEPRREREKRIKFEIVDETEKDIEDTGYNPYDVK